MILKMCRQCSAPVALLRAAFGLARLPLPPACALPSPAADRDCAAGMSGAPSAGVVPLQYQTT